MTEWNKLDNSIREAETVNQFKAHFKEFMKLKERSLFSVHDPLGVKLLTRLRLKFSHLKEHKFRHNFNDTVSPMCNCGTETETNDHYFLRCPFFNSHRKKLLDSLYEIDISLKGINNTTLVDILLFGSDSYSENINKNILSLTLSFIKSTDRFEKPLFDQ